MKAEERIQQEIVQWFRNTYCLKHHNPRMAIFSVPNDGQNVIEQQRKKATGLMAGVSDLIIVTKHEVLFIEVKDDKGKQQPKQIEFEEIVINLGQIYFVVRSLEEFQKLIQSFLGLYK